MDHIDREILQILQHNARASLKMIAEKTFLSSPAVSARIEKLEKDGIITSYQAQIDPMKLGYHIRSSTSMCFRRISRNSITMRKGFRIFWNAAA